MARESNDFLIKFRRDDKGQKHYLAHAYNFICTFLSTVNPNTETAYYIMHELEDELLNDDRFIEGLPSRHTYQEELRRINKERAPLEDQQRHLESEKTRLRIQRRRTTLSAKERSDVELQLVEKEHELEAVKADLARLKRPDSRKVYPTSGLVFKGKKEKGKLYARDDDWKYVLDWLASEAKELQKEDPTPLYKNLSLLFNILKGSAQQHGKVAKNWAVEERAITFLLIHQKEKDLEKFINHFAKESQEAYNYIMAKMIGVKDEAQISNLFTEESPLVQYGLITPPSEAGVPTISKFLVELLSKHDLTEEKLRAELSGKPLTTDLDWEKDFHHLGDKGVRLEKLIRHSMAQKRTGKHNAGPVFFFSGLPDTGKTSAVAALGKHLGLNVRVIGEKLEKTKRNSDDDDKKGKDSKLDPLTPMDRLSQILMSLAVAGNNPNTLFLVEEPDTFLPLDRVGNAREVRDPVDRVVIQRLFEENPATALFFTTNHWREIHPAVRRRAAMQISLDTPDRHQRAEIIRNVLASHNKKAAANGIAEIHLPEADINLLAATYKAPAGKWASAIPNAIITAGGDPARLKEEIIFFIEAQAERDYGSASVIKAAHLPAEYDFNLSNATIRGGTTLEEFRDALVKDVNEKGSNKFRVLLDGWPGTGKSEFVWHLAEKLNKDVLYVKASDLLSMWVGETEKNIAMFFEKARQSGAILMIDEVDSVLRNRADAQRNWEVTQVNEFLTQLEHYEGMIAVTTNHADDVDPAAFRRFKRRVAFDFMNHEQCIYAYEKFFGQVPDEIIARRLSRLDNLSPADFLLVKEDANFFGFKDQPGKIISALEEISEQKPKEHKPKWNKRLIGFTSESTFASMNGDSRLKGRIPVGEHTRKVITPAPKQAEPGRTD